jgi:hypothetical protein
MQGRLYRRRLVTFRDNNSQQLSQKNYLMKALLQSAEDKMDY